jgi:hypothetical protein
MPDTQQLDSERLSAPWVKAALARCAPLLRFGNYSVEVVHGKPHQLNVNLKFKEGDLGEHGR